MYQYINSEYISNSKPIYDIIGGHLSNIWVFFFILLAIVLLAFFTLIFKGKLSLKLPGGTGLDLGADPSKNIKDDKNIENSKEINLKKNTDSNIVSNKVNPFYSAPHNGCPHIVDFKHVVNKTTYVVSKISEIKYIGCISEQMNYTEEQLIYLKTIYQKTYIDKLREKIKLKNNGDVKNEYCYEDYRYYQAVIKLMIHDMESVIRASFSNKYLTTYSQSDYKEYIDLKFNVLKSIETDFIDTMYIGDWMLNRDEIFELHRANRIQLKQVIEDIYLRAQKISEMKQKEVEQLEQELQDFLNFTVSGDIKIDKT